MNGGPDKAVKETVFHGQTIKDEYAWLRDPSYPEVKDPAILAFLNKENTKFDTFCKKHDKAIDELTAELKGRIKEDDEGVPVPYHGYDYFWKFETGAQYRKWFRKSLESGKSELLIDENRLADGHDYFNLRQMSVSPDNKLLAYSTDVDGSERYRIKIKNLYDGQDMDLSVNNCSGSIIWLKDQSGILYVELNESLRPFRVRLCSLAGKKNGSDPILYEESDPGFFVSLRKTLDEEWIQIATGSHESNEIWLLRNQGRIAEQKAICPARRRDQHLYSVDHQKGTFFILSNDLHKNFRLVKTSADSCGEEHWSEVLAGSDEHYLLNLMCLKDYLVLVERFKGLDTIRVFDQAMKDHAVNFNQEIYSTGLGDNREFDTTTIRLHFSSLIQPQTVYDYDIKAKKLITRKVQEIPSGYNQDLYESERLWAISHDETPIPISIVRPKTFELNGEGPLLLYGYGSYGMGMDPGFSLNRLSLLNRGMAYAIAHIRGGDELGYHWYENGKKNLKTNTFKDFIACAEHLVENRYTKPGKIAILGGSAGGMLTGAVSNMRPDLWGSVVSLVPFVDVLNTMLDGSLPLTPIEWPEWGNPIEDPNAFSLIRSYSPYDNIEAKAYPPMLVTAGISDPRVTYWEPAKYVARLRDQKTDKNPLYLKTNMGAGHFGASGRFDSLKEMAEIYMFIFSCFNIPFHAEISS